MAKRKGKKKSGGRRRSYKAKAKRVYRRFRRGRKIETPNKLALQVGAAIVAVEVLDEAVLPDVIPEFVSDEALGIWLLALKLRIPLVQQVAYGVEFAHLARTQGLTSSLVDTVEGLTEGLPIIGGGGSTPALGGGGDVTDAITAAAIQGAQEALSGQ